MSTFTDEEKTVSEFSDSTYFDYGVHKVAITVIELGETDSGKEFIEVGVVGDKGEEDTARVWFTTPKARNFSFNVLREIYVHNTPDDEKDVARQKFDALKSTEQLEVLMQKVIGGECWFSKYQSPDRTYQDRDGNTRRSVDKNVYGYEPKLKANLIPRRDDNINPADYPDDDVAKGEPFPSTGIPKEW